MHIQTLPRPLFGTHSLYNAGRRLTRWLTRTHQRAQAHGKLSRLNDHMLRDIGLERRDLYLHQPDHGALSENHPRW